MRRRIHGDMKVIILRYVQPNFRPKAKKFETRDMRLNWPKLCSGVAYSETTLATILQILSNLFSS